MSRYGRPTRLQAYAIVAAGLLLSLPTVPVWAINFGSGTYGACQYGSCSVSISSNGSVAVNVTPSASGTCTVQSDTVSVLTDSSSGYSLTLADSSSNTNLVNGGNSIAAASATQSSPAALGLNTWGY